MDIPINILKEIWLVTTAMAPYLLFGFLMAGVLSVLISKDYVRRHLGGHGVLGSVKAALIGVPMPICSCGVIPLAASLRKHGASRGATASFLASTPQTGVDSLMITYALLGWVFALFRAMAAFVSGIVCGTAVAAVSPRDEEAPPECRDECCQPNEQPVLKRMLLYGFVSLPRDISRSMALGIVASGIISGLIPDNFFEGQLGSSPATMFVMLLIGIPLYVCSAASVPIALAFIKAGISPGAALVFLITGPATNAATLTTLWQIIGKKQLGVFLATLAGCALLAGMLINLFTPSLGIIEQVCHEGGTNSILDLVWTALLIAVLAKGMLPERKPAG
ncbi:permease [Pontiella sulfatireligans]|uniref:Two-component membrane permease complex subunit SMU_747c n=1 Tax=Pontiella sulfatireligans TaxID=2750658 RepID=A0A6C2UKS7_9BACT|nr:permease [Pontiella sulfatireligans]VGO20017.1 Putative two-component membrane permease complex subunit SMU_747c [Pontiella sulfatireligans]